MHIQRCRVFFRKSILEYIECLCCRYVLLFFMFFENHTVAGISSKEFCANMSLMLCPQQCNYTDEDIDKNLLGIATIYNNVIVLQGCRTILRKDYDRMPRVVKLISSGKLGHDLACTDCVSPGMLTATICGSCSDAPRFDIILKVIEETDSDRSSGTLLIVHPYGEYHMNFILAKLHAEAKGYNVKILTINDDIRTKCLERFTNKHASLAMLFIYKIAGAMSEEGKDLNEIYIFCNNIVNIAILTVRTEYNDVTFGEAGVAESKSEFFKHMAKSVIDILIDTSKRKIQTDSDGEQTFCTGCEAAIMIDNLGCCQVQTNIFTLELLKQLKTFGMKVKRLYVRSSMTIPKACGFHICFLNLSTSPLLINYLDSPTSAPGWPKVSSSGITEIQQDDEMKVMKSRCCDTMNRQIPYVEVQGPIVDSNIGQIFLTAISIACEALIACTEQLNIIGEESGDANCGTNFARGAGIIYDGIQKNEILGTSPFVVFMQISSIFGKIVGGFQGGIYSLFFHAVAETFRKYPRNEPITIYTWLNALIAANKTVSDLGKLSIGNRTILDALIPAQYKLAEVLEEESDPIHAFGATVKAAEYSAMKTIHMHPLCASRLGNNEFKYPDPGAHSVGIWMRGAYEATKLKLFCHVKK